MGKRKWKRVKPQDLADPEEQNRILGLLAQASQPAPNTPQGSHQAQGERRGT